MVAQPSSYSMPPPPPTGDAVTAFQRHEEAVAGFRTALADLDGSPSFVMLGGGSLGPETARLVGEAAGYGDDLWPLVNALGAALDEIRTATGVGGFAPNRAELKRLIEQRWLPDPIESGAPYVSLADLSERFRTRFDAVRHWAAEIDRLWLAVLPRVDAARASLARLRTEADNLNIREPLIGRASDLQADLEARLVADPLSVSTDDGAALDDLVAQASQQLASVRTGIARLDEDLAATETLLSELRVLRARAEAAGSESRAKVTAPVGLVRVPAAEVLDGSQGLAARLDDVYRRLDGLSAGQRRALVDGWLAMARRLEAQLRRAEEVNREPLERRDELRGRLVAYRAKMSAIGRAEDLEATAVADRARTQLYTAPVDLTTAAATIDELARMLRS